MRRLSPGAFRVQAMDITRYCKKCKTTKHTSEFTIRIRTYKSKEYRIFQSGCKACINAHSRAYQATHKKDRSEYDRARYRTKMLGWASTKSPIPWATLKHRPTQVKHMVYPIHTCGRRYIDSLGCLLCIRDSVGVERNMA